MWLSAFWGMAPDLRVLEEDDFPVVAAKTFSVSAEVTEFVDWTPKGFDFFEFFLTCLLPLSLVLDARP